LDEGYFEATQESDENQSEKKKNKLKAALQKAPEPKRMDATRVEIDKEKVEVEEKLRNMRKRANNNAMKMPDDIPKPAGQEEDDEDDEEDGKKKKKVPRALMKVLYFQPEEDEEGIPTSMLEDAFREIDVDGGGNIDASELVDALNRCGLPVSNNAADAIMKEVDKNASGDIDIIEFIEFFRQIEELTQFGKKAAARQQFCSFLLQFCFVSHFLAVGVMSMMFMRMNPTDNADNYSIMKNVLIALSVVLILLCMASLVVPILKLKGRGWDRKHVLLKGKRSRTIAIARAIMEVKREAEAAEKEALNKGKPIRQEVVETDRDDDEERPPNPAWAFRTYRQSQLQPAQETGDDYFSAYGGIVQPQVQQQAYDPMAQASLTQSSTGFGLDAGTTRSSFRADTTASSFTELRQAGKAGKSSPKAEPEPTQWRYDPGAYQMAAAVTRMNEFRGHEPRAFVAMRPGERRHGLQDVPGVPMELIDAAPPH